MKYLNTKKILLLITVILISMAFECNLTSSRDRSGDDKPYTPPPDVDTYTAEVPTRWDVWKALDSDGYVVTGTGTDWVYGVNAVMKYQLTFPRIGGTAQVAKIFTDYEVVDINNPQNYSQEERSTMMSRTEWPAGIEYIEPVMTFVKPPNEYGYFKWTKEGNEYRGDVIIGNEGYLGLETIFHIVFKRPTASMNQTYIIVDPEYPQFGGMANQGKP